MVGLLLGLQCSADMSSDALKKGKRFVQRVVSREASLSSPVRRPASVVRCPSSAVCHLSSGVRLPLFQLAFRGSP